MIPGEQTDILYEIYRKYPAVSTDSRNILVGSIFFALRGSNFDGNRFAGAALEQGAAFAVVDDEKAVSEYVSRNPGEDVLRKFMIVEDTLLALQSLAAHHRKKLGIPIIAITGTNGKTTTKELAAAVLSKKYNVYSTRGNLNNHIGVPLTILAMDADTEIGIVEMGASAEGEITLLCSIARPDYGLITNVGRAHLEGFGGEEGVRRGKGELYDYLAANNGKAFVMDGDAVLIKMAGERTALDIVSYDICYADNIGSALVGGYNKLNIAAAVAIGRFFGVEENDIASAIENYRVENNRSQRIVTKRNTVVADCYNANPSSMGSAIDTFFSADETGQNGVPLKKMLILGEMKELGEWSEEEHRRIIDKVLSVGTGTVLFVGKEFARFTQDLNNIVNSSLYIKVYDDVRSLGEDLRKRPPVAYHILVKGSNSVGLDRILTLL